MRSFTRISEIVYFDFSNSFFQNLGNVKIETVKCNKRKKPIEMDLKIEDCNKG